MTQGPSYLQVILTVFLFTLFSFVSVFAWSKPVQTEAGLPSQLTSESREGGLELGLLIEEGLQNQDETHAEVQKQLQVYNQDLENEPLYRRRSQFSRIRRTADARSAEKNDGLQIRLVKSRKM